MGWFSLGLGLAQVAAPAQVARLIGVPDDDENRSVMRAVGLREIASGIGILSQPRPAGWAWARVGGDVMDLSLLGGAWASDRTDKERVAAATVAVVGVMALDLLAGPAERPAGQDDYSGPGAQLKRPRGERSALERRRPCQEERHDQSPGRGTVPLLARIREPAPLHEPPGVVQTLDAKRSHWRAKGPAGLTFEWDAEITEDRPNERMAWQSVPGSSVRNAGSVNFKRLPAAGARW